MKQRPFLKCRNSKRLPLLALLALSASAHADSATWNGSNEVWSTLGNWSGSPLTVPGAADTATFSSTGFTGTAAVPINNTGTVSVANISFDAAAQNYFIGGAVNLSAGGGVTVNAGSQTFVPTGSVPAINTLGSASFTNNGGGLLSLGIGTTAAGSVLSFGGSGNITTTSTLGATNASSVEKSGSGTLTLGNFSNTNIHGGFTITGGTVIAQNANALSNRALNIGGAILEMTSSNAASFNNANSNINITGDTTFHYSAASGNWNIGNNAATSLFRSTGGSHTVTFTNTAEKINGIRLVGDTSGFSGTYKLGQNGALTFNGFARGSSTSILNMGDAGTGSHYFSTGVVLHDTATQAISPIRFGALTGTDTAAVMSGRQNVGTNTTGTQFEIGGLNTNTTYAGKISDGSTATLLLQSNGTASAGNQTADATFASSNYSRNAGAAGVQGTTELVKVGSGTLTLTGTNSHTGGTVIKGGTLAVSSDSALGAAYNGSLRGFQLTLAATGGVVYQAADLPDLVLTGGSPSTAASANVFAVSQGAAWNQNNLFLSFSSQGNDTTAGSITNTETGSGYISVPTVSFTGGTITTAGTAPVASVRVQGLLTLDGGTLQTNAGITSNRAIHIGAAGGTISTQGFDSTFSGNVNGPGNLNLTGGGTVNLSSATNSLTGTLTIGAQTTLDLAGALAGSVQVESTGILKGGGSIGGTLHLDAGAMLDVSDGLLSVATGKTVSFGGFGFNNLIGFDVNTAAPGIYTLIGGGFTLDSANISNFGLANALDLGGGRSGYFQEGSLSVVIIPEPGAAILGCLGALALLRRRRR
jgi:fibronectin-binding autotransporter adhesin